MSENLPLRDEGVPDRADMVVPVRAGKAYHFAFFALWIIEILLFFRLVLKLLGANPDNVFALLIYGSTYILVLPFKSIFPSVVSTAQEPVKKVFETSTLFGMMVYVIIVWVVAKFIILKESRPHQDRRGGF